MSTRTRKTSATLGLLVREERRDGYYHVRAYPVWVGRTPDELRDLDRGHPVSAEITRETVRNVNTTYTLHQGLYLDGLQVGSQGNDSDGTDRRLYGWEVEYRDVFSVDRRTAERMHKTLATLERKMQALTDRYGRPATYGAYLLRVAAAIGATRIVLQKMGERETSYSRMDLRHCDLSDGAYSVDRRITKWIEEGQPQQPQAQAGEAVQS